jgi:hypothetical protein
MELQQLNSMMIQTSNRINRATQEIYKMAKEKAQTEYEYRKALGQEIARLKAEGYQATLIPDVSRGNVAELKLKRDMAEVMFKSAIESMRALQAELSGLQSISRHQSEI